MGFFSNVLKVGGILAAPFTGGASLALTGAGFAMDAAEKQAQAQERAGDIVGAAETRRIAIEEAKEKRAQQLFDLGFPLEEARVQAAQELLPGLTEFADVTKAGTGPQFEIPLAQGQRALASSLAPFGLSDSSTRGIATGELTANLLGQDIDRRLGIARGIAGVPSPVGQATNLFGQVTGASPFVGTQAQIAAQSPQAGLFGDIANLATFAGTGGIDFSKFKFTNPFASSSPTLFT